MFDSLIETATKSLTKAGYHLLDDGVNRGGALEWVWVKIRGERHAYVGVATLQVKPDSYWVEVWFGAEDAARHTGRQVIREYQDRSGSEIEYKLEKDIVSELHAAAERAEKVDSSDMPNVYPPIPAFGNHNAAH